MTPRRGDKRTDIFISFLLSYGVLVLHPLLLAIVCLHLIAGRFKPPRLLVNNDVELLCATLHSLFVVHVTICERMLLFQHTTFCQARVNNFHPGFILMTTMNVACPTTRVSQRSNVVYERSSGLMIPRLAELPVAHINCSNPYAGTNGGRMSHW